MTHARSSSGLPPVSIHADFIKERLPSWATKARPAILAELRSSLIRNNQSRHDLNELLGQVQSPEIFVRPLFRDALRRHLRGLDADKTLFVREWRNQHLLGLYSTHARTTEQSLLEAALQNFEPRKQKVAALRKVRGCFCRQLTGECEPRPRRLLLLHFAAALI